MTCMAYRDGVLAADRQVTHNSLMSETDGKILIIDENTVMAFAGALSIGEYFKDWHKAGAIREDWTFSKEVPDRCCFVVLVMRVANGEKIELTYWDDIVLPLALDPNNYHGYGSGRELALGAMHAGADAVDAVFAANHHLDDCGFGVCLVDGNEPELIVQRLERIQK